MPVLEPQANTRHTLITVLDGLHVVELKETHLMKQAHRTPERGQSWVRTVEKLPGGVGVGLTSGPRQQRDLHVPYRKKS